MLELATILETVERPEGATDAEVLELTAVAEMDDTPVWELKTEELAKALVEEPEPAFVDLTLQATQSR